MINRENWKFIRTYLDYRKEIHQLSEKSLRLEETWLRYLLEWADEIAFEDVATIKPRFPEYLINARKKEVGKPLSKEFMRKIIGSSKGFFRWLIMIRPGFKSKITAAYLDTLRTPKIAITHTEHEYVTLEEIMAMAQASVQSLRDERIRASAVFWFLSGIRIGAFVTLPIKAVDMNELSVKQWPGLGVKTKNNKHATTFLLNIPELVEVVKDWDCKVREKLPATSFWFAPLSPDTATFDPLITEVGYHRTARARKDLKAWLNWAGLPHHSPHKFRHGNAVYSIKQSKDLADLKAVSQNLMHSNVSITDGIYGLLSIKDIGKRISNLNSSSNYLGEDVQEQILKILINIDNSHQ